MDNNPLELLDIDNLDLPSFIRPTNQSSSNSTRLIPSPIGVLQAAMMNRQSRNPWLYALDFIRSQGLVNADDTPHRTPLGSIGYTFNCVPLTVIIVKSCTPTILDPTGTIDATMKQRIIEGQDFSPYMTDIHVVVFCPFPSRSKCYLNITLHNVVKVMFFHFRLPILLVFTNLHCILICC
ncbi:hypothetical protein GmHk_17G049141 [Glycine max]|nr:hypothetical protein GmHk_17G049141 [Glycine max]